MSLTGRTIGGYQIMEELGRGAMGVVFKARQISMERTVALKFLPNRLAKDEKIVARFLREARAAGQLTHPNIVGVHDVGVMEGLHYIAMEFVDGNSVHSRIREKGTFSEKDALAVAAQIGEALKFAHGRGILHRDIKPDNFLIDSSDRVRLADLGLARFMNDSGGQNAELTQDGTAMGTPHYMAPEQCKGGTVDARSDLYSLGAAMFVMASGKMPYDANTAAAVMVKVLTEAPRKLKEVAPELSAGYIAVVEKAMSKDPAKRFQTAQEFVDALAQCKAGTYRPVTASFSTVTRPANSFKSKALPLAVGAAGAIALIIGMVIADGNRRQREQAERDKKDATANADAKTQVTPDKPKSSDPKTVVASSGKTPDKTDVKPPDVSGKSVTSDAADDKDKDDVAGTFMRRFVEKRLHEAKRAMHENPRAAWNMIQGMKEKVPADKQSADFKTALSVVEDELKDVAAKEWKEVVGKAAELLRENKFQDAMALAHKFQEKYPYASEAKDAIAALDSGVAKLNEYATGLLNAGELEKARDALQPTVKLMADYAPAEPVRQTYAKVEAKLQERQAQEEKELAELVDLQKKAWALTRDMDGKKERQYDFAQAAELFRDLGKKLKFDRNREQAEALGVLYNRANEFFKRLREAVNASAPKVEVDLGRVTGQLLSWKDEKFVMYKDKNNPLEQRWPVKQIPPDSFIEIAALLKIASSDTPNDLFDLGSFAFAAGEEKLAVDKLTAAAGKDKQYTSHASTAMQILAPAIKSDREKQAAEMLSQAQAMAKAPKVDRDKLFKLLNKFVVDFADTAVAKSNQDEITKLRQTAPSEGKKDDESDQRKKEEDLKKAERDAAKALVIKTLTDAGWKTIEGDWSFAENSKTRLVLKGAGKLESPLKDATVNLGFKLEAGATLDVLLRYEEEVDNKLEKFLNRNNGKADVGKGYGAMISSAFLNVYGNKSLRDFVKRDQAPVLDNKVPVRLAGQGVEVKDHNTHNLEVMAAGRGFDVILDRKSLFRNSYEMRDGGTVVIQASGGVSLDSPRVLYTAPKQ